MDRAIGFDNQFGFVAVKIGYVNNFLPKAFITHTGYCRENLKPSVCLFLK